MLFYNGAGKTFLVELLTLLLVGGMSCFTKVSTTTSSNTDWCGRVPAKGEPNVCGVVDVLLDGVPAVGEVKQAGGKEGCYQLYKLLHLHVVRVIPDYPVLY